MPERFGAWLTSSAKAVGGSGVLASFLAAIAQNTLLTVVFLVVVVVPSVLKIVLSYLQARQREDDNTRIMLAVVDAKGDQAVWDAKARAFKAIRGEHDDRNEPPGGRAA